MDIRIIKEPITRAEAKEIGKEFYQNMVKGVADVERGIIALGGEYHMDANTVLADDGSAQKNLWGFNLYFNKTNDADRIEYRALVNIRPIDGNSTAALQDEGVKAAIKNIVDRLVP